MLLSYVLYLSDKKRKEKKSVTSQYCTVLCDMWYMHDGGVDVLSDFDINIIEY